MVINRSDGRRTSFWRSLADVSPVRMATSGRKNGTAAASGSLAANRSAARPMPASGALRFFSTSKARARSGEMYSTRVRRLRSSGGGLVTSRSIDVRKAARVLPLPVGAQMSVCRPATIGGHPSI